MRPAARLASTSVTVGAAPYEPVGLPLNHKKHVWQEGLPVWSGTGYGRRRVPAVQATKRIATAGAG
jgi:hypothetical protein